MSFYTLVFYNPFRIIFNSCIQRLFKNLQSVENSPNYEFVKGNITNKNLMEQIEKITERRKRFSIHERHDIL